MPIGNCQGMNQLGKTLLNAIKQYWHFLPINILTLLTSPIVYFHFGKHKSCQLFSAYNFKEKDMFRKSMKYCADILMHVLYFYIAVVAIVSVHATNEEEAT